MNGDETDESISDAVDPDLVLASGSDSSVEGKAVATSVDGEDGLVDVTMKESKASYEDIETNNGKLSNSETKSPLVPLHLLHASHTNPSQKQA